MASSPTSIDHHYSFDSDSSIVSPTSFEGPNPFESSSNCDSDSSENDFDVNEFLTLSFDNSLEYYVDQPKEKKKMRFEESALDSSEMQLFPKNWEVPRMDSFVNYS